MGRGVSAIVDPDKVRATIEFTFTLGEWKQIRKFIETGKTVEWPLSDITSSIVDLSIQMEKAFYAKPTNDQP